MRQDAARSISQQLNRPDSSGAAGFKLGSNVELRDALHKWENKNDPLAVLMRNRMSSANRGRQTEAEDQQEEVVAAKPVEPPKRIRKNCPNKYKEKLAAMTPEELIALRNKQREVSRIRSEKLLKERESSMTPEELQIFRERSERMKKFRAELKERQSQQKPQ